MAALTDRVRTAVAVAFCTTVAAGLVGWFLNKDISPLAVMLTPQVLALGVGEASNVGKRWTTRPELGAGSDTTQ